MNSYLDCNAEKRHFKQCDTFDYKFTYLDFIVMGFENMRGTNSKGLNISPN